MMGAVTTHATPEPDSVPSLPPAGILPPAGTDDEAPQTWRPSRRLIVLLTVLAAVVTTIVAAAVVPINMVIEAPGPTWNVLGSADADGPQESGGQGSVINITGARTYPADGALRMTTVSVRGCPGSPVTVLDVALACIGRPRALVLDEPTSGIDPVARAELWEFLRRRRGEGVAVLASTHDLSEAEAYADRLLVLDRGRLILQGTVEDVLGPADGRWRLRLIGADPSVDAWARARGLDLVGTGEVRVLIADKETVTAMADVIEAARGRGELRYQDILKGPIRLEDVFAEAVSRADRGAAA